MQSMDRLEIIELKLRGDIAQTEELLDLAQRHKTPFISTHAQKLEESRERLAQLIVLRNKDYSEQELEAFLTPTEKEAFSVFNRIFDSERLRTNLLLTSLYLTAFEVLVNSIIPHIDDFFVPLTKDYLGPPHLKKQHQQTRAKMTSKYKQEIGVKFSTSPNYKLIPSCKWLQKNGVLNDEEIEEIKKIRDHRHSLAHDLPELILSDVDLMVNLEHFMRIRELVRKVQLFWIHIDMDIKGIDEDISDEDISGGWGFLDLLISTVLDFLNTTQVAER